MYFIDSGAGESTPAFEAVRDLIPDLKNDAADQAYDCLLYTSRCV